MVRVVCFGPRKGKKPVKAETGMAVLGRAVRLYEWLWLYARRCGPAGRGGRGCYDRTKVFRLPVKLIPTSLIRFKDGQLINNLDIISHFQSGLNLRNVFIILKEFCVVIFIFLKRERGRNEIVFGATSGKHRKVSFW